MSVRFHASFLLRLSLIKGLHLNETMMPISVRDGTKLGGTVMLISVSIRTPSDFRHDYIQCANVFRLAYNSPVRAQDAPSESRE